MHVQTVGKRKVALGLKWVELEPGRSPAAAFKQMTAPKASGLHTVLTHADGRKVMGVVESPPTGTFYSAAHALAASGQDGIYVMSVQQNGERALWYVVIQDGLVVPETDVIHPSDMCVAAVNDVRHISDLPLYCADQDSAWDDALYFDPDTVFSTANIKPLVAIGRTGQGKLLVLLLVLATGGGLWYIMQPPKIDDAQLRAEQAWQARRQYLASLRVAVQSPADSGWIVDVWSQSHGIFPPVVSGWHLQTLHCTTKQCLATYQAPDGQVRATTPVRTWFATWADVSVQILPNDQNTLTVRLPLTVPMQVWTDDQLLAPTAWMRPALDVAGRMGLYFAGLKQEGAVTTDPIGSGRPNDANPLNQETIVLHQTMNLDAERLRSLVAWFGSEGFVVHQLLAVPSFGNTIGNVRLELVRYSGAPTV